MSAILSSNSKPNVLFICVGNSARSQIAEGLMRHKAGDRFNVYSAGSRPSREVHRLAILTMSEIGLDIRDHRPKGFADLPLGITFDYVLSVCDMGLGGCPYAPARKRNCHWELLDPVPLANALGDDAKGLRIFRTTREIISEVVDELIAEESSPRGSFPELTSTWTSKHFAAVLRDFGHLCDITDPVVAGLRMFTVLDRERKAASSPDSWRRVFVAHGHDKKVRDQIVAHLSTHPSALPVVLQDIDPDGHTIIEKLEHYSDVAAAIVIVTGDDLAMPKTTNSTLRPRTRENVIFEMGYFVAKLGRSRILALVKDDVQLPSDLAGLDVVSFDRANQWHKRIDTFLSRTIRPSHLR